MAQLGWQLAGSVHHCLYMVSMNCAEVPLSSLRAGVVRDRVRAPALAKAAEPDLEAAVRRDQTGSIYDKKEVQMSKVREKAAA